METTLKKIYQARLDELRTLGFTVERTNKEYDYYKIFPKGYIYLGALCGNSYGPKYFHKKFKYDSFQITLYAYHIDKVTINKLKLLGYKGNNEYLHYGYSNTK